MLKCCCQLICRGASHWLTQRITALIMLLYFAPILYFWLACPKLGYMWWSSFLSSDLMLGLLLLNMLMFFLHALIGIWTVLTDYVKNSCLRNILLLGFVGYMGACLAWAIVATII